MLRVHPIVTRHEQIDINIYLHHITSDETVVVVIPAMRKIEEVLAISDLVMPTKHIWGQ
jgi:hypothetical protein